MVHLKKLSFLLFTALLSLIFLFQFFYIANNAKPEEKKNAINPVPTAFKPLPSKSCSFLKWFDPNTNDKEGKLLLKNCSSCHMAYYNEWVSDKHSMSQNNPFFLSVYKQFKQDHPDQNGNCALCHNPEAALDENGGVNLTRKRFEKTNGISCDFCHKIESVDQNPLKQGVEGLNIFRLCKGQNDVRFGPLKDPVQPGKNEELRYNSLYKTSLSCAKCHDGSNGNIQIYSTFTEWLNSPAAKKGVQCQNCHMAPRKNANVIVDNPVKAIHELPQHKERPYHQIHSHSFLTEDPFSFRKKYVDLTVETRHRRVSMTDRDTLIVTCKVENNNFGHSFPTGSPMRNVILLVEAKDKNGNNLKLIKGPRLPNYAGNLKNKPGKLFAKILSETNSEYARKHGESGINFRKIAKELGIPAQDWWNVFVLSDTRIKANEQDISVYEFDVVGNGRDHSLQTEITVKLIWRNTWPGLARLKGFKLKEDILLEKNLLVKQLED